jgi:programmed cell death protein 5
MEDDELEKLREEKREEIQEQEQDREAQQQEMENQIWSRAAQYMSSEAKDRLSNIKAADKQKALSVAQQIARMGEAGRVSQVDDRQMKEILKSIEKEKQDSKSDIKFRR